MYFFSNNIAYDERQVQRVINVAWSSNVHKNKTDVIGRKRGLIL